jgi:tryptophanyl-tRNA synthetase
MSKSSGSIGSFIALTDTADEITKKIKRAVTDSDGIVKATADKPAITNLLGIHSLLSGQSIPELEAHFEGKGYGALKTELAEVVVTSLAPMQARLAEYNADPSYALGVLADGAVRARERASRKLDQVRTAMGIEINLPAST